MHRPNLRRSAQKMVDSRGTRAADSTMTIYVSARTYGAGGGPALSWVGPFFAFRHPDFGTAIRELEVEVHFATPRVPGGDFKEIEDRYEAFLATLPTTKFHRKRATFELAYLSRIGDSRRVADSRADDLDLFVRGAQEMAAELAIIGPKLKRSDAFDFAAFSGWLRTRLAALPQTEAELRQLTERLAVEARSQAEAMDPWGRLDIDWDEYHPQARELLDDPFYWECANDFAPHGNDTGADILEFYRERGDRTQSGGQFLDGVLRDWGMDPMQPPDDPLMVPVWEDAKIAVAFAQLKIDATCEEAVRAGALDAIARCRTRIKAKHADWELLGERLQTLENMESKLKPSTS
jgi:hypothetical protein